MAAILTKEEQQKVIEIIQELYLEDNIPWICGYSGGKDSSATVQLVWTAIKQLPPEKRTKKIHIISSDTLVESPVVAAWARKSLENMQTTAVKNNLPIVPHLLTPDIPNTFWVNLIGKGYPYPRPNFRWCTDRLKIAPSNVFIKSVLEAESEAILVLGMRKAESNLRERVMESYEKKRYRAHLSPNGAYPNTYVFTPIENWSDKNVWQFLIQNKNPWGTSNMDLMAMYRGASSDNECPLVVESGTPSCGGSRMGCWICTMVTQDKSLTAMIQNDEEKAWMQPMLDFRNYIAAYSVKKEDAYADFVINKNNSSSEYDKSVQHEVDRARRDFRRMGGRLSWFNDDLVHGPYTKEFRHKLLKGLLVLQEYIHQYAPEDVRKVDLITHDELAYIRKIWRDDKHEFEDAVSNIYKEVTGKDFQDTTLYGNKFYGPEEWNILKETCEDIMPGYELMLELESSLLDLEAKNSAVSSTRNIIQQLEAEIKKAYYKNKEDARNVKITRNTREAITPIDNTFVNEQQEVNILPVDDEV